MTGIVILAAGGSVRLGRPKQQLLYKGKTLVENAIQAGVDSICRPIVVVLGAGSNNLIPIISGEGVHVIQNEHWQQGMGSSIQCGIKELLQIGGALSDAIIMTCDQPFVDHSLLNGLIEKKRGSGKEIIASFYNNTVGVPVLFHKTFFPQLLQLQGQEGAKKLLFDNEQLIATISFPAGNIDIDTDDDYNKLTADVMSRNI